MVLSKENVKSKQYSLVISQNIKYLLDLYSMNILDLSNKINVSYSAVYRIVHALSFPNFTTLLKIANFFNLKIAELIGEMPLQKSKSTYYWIKSIPIISWQEITIFLGDGEAKNTINNLLISSAHYLSDSSFALKSNFKTKPLFAQNSMLIFDKIENDIQEYDNKFVLVTDKDHNTAPSLGKVSVDLGKTWLYSLSNPQLQEPAFNYNILACLIITITEF